MAEMNPGQTWECEQKLPLPIGVSNYCLAASEYYYIDKTMMIKDFIDERPMVTLFTRPRRFGKTLNMDMLRTYFERSDKDTSVYFGIKKYGPADKSIEITKSALLDLSAMLHSHYDVAPVIIIDEYDTPIQQGHSEDYYDKIIRFMRNLFSGGFKDNSHLSFGFLTGILRVAKESIFSGMNNLSINSVLDNKYSAYFGFTADEVREMAAYYDAADKYDEICQWYDGYLFGKTEIFNPWSVVSYFSNKCEPRPFWVSTGSNDVIGEVLAVADNEIYDRLTSLVNGETFTTFIDTDVIYPQIKSNPSTIYSFLLMTGYLKVLNTSLSFNGDFLCEVALPNREISLVYNKEILQRMENIIPQATAISIQEATFSGDHKRLKSQLQMLLTQSVSFFDTAGENFYHGFMLGLCALMSGTFATSNRESGDGRYDIQLKPIRKGMPGILIELKAGKNCSDEELKNMSEAALKQITDKKYDTEMKNAGIQTIYKYGVAFSGKNVEIAVE